MNNDNNALGAFSSASNLLSDGKSKYFDLSCKYKCIWQTVVMCISAIFFMSSSLTRIIFDRMCFDVYVQTVLNDENASEFFKITVNVLNATPYIYGLAAIICLMAALIPQLYCKGFSFVISLGAWVTVFVIITSLLLEKMPYIMYFDALLFAYFMIISTIYSICVRCCKLDEKELMNIKAETALACFVPIYNIYWVYKKEKQIVKAAAVHSLIISDNSIVYTLLTVFGLGFISYCLMTSQLNRIYKSLS